MATASIISRNLRTIATRCQGLRNSNVQCNFIPHYQRHSFHSSSVSPNSGVAGQMKWQTRAPNSYTFQRIGISSCASSHSNQIGTSQNEGDLTDIHNDTKQSTNAANSCKTNTSGQKVEESGSIAKDVSMEDLVKLVAENEGLLKTKQEEIEKMKNTVRQRYDEMEKVTKRTKREVENFEKLEIQKFGKSLLDVADKLGRTSSAVKEGFAKIDISEDSAGAVPVLINLLNGVEMTEKQLAEVFKKYGVEKCAPKKKQLDPSRQKAVFQETDSKELADSAASILKWTAVLGVASVLGRWWWRRHLASRGVDR